MQSINPADQVAATTARTINRIARTRVYCEVCGRRGTEESHLWTLYQAGRPSRIMHRECDNEDRKV